LLFLASGFGFLAAVIVGRALGPTNLGVLVLATTTVASIATFLDFSLEEAVIHFGARLIEEGAPGAVRALLRTSVRLDAAVGAAVFAAIFLAADPIARFVSHGEIAPLLVRLAAVEMLTTTLNGTSGAALMLGGRAELRAWAIGCTMLLRLIAVYVAVHVVGGGAQTVLWAYIAGSGLAAIGQLLLARRVARAWGGTRVERPPVSTRQLATFGLHSSVTTTLVAARVALIAIVLGRRVGAVQVGLLSVAMLPVTLANVVTSPLRMMTFPEQATLAAQRRLDVLWRGVQSYTAVAVLVGVVAAAIGFVLLPILLPWLYTDAFRDAVTPARILLPAAVASLAVAWAKALPAAIGRPQIRSYVSLGEFLVTLAAVLAVASHGAVGAATAISLTAVLAAGVWYAVARRILRVGPERAPA
jgi:O-antigen/teichoic acid export membrane protein